ncbi:MAG: hypothetical protein V1911_04080 [Candidatus Micrarchaeota archaeon]
MKKSKGFVIVGLMFVLLLAGLVALNYSLRSDDITDQTYAKLIQVDSAVNLKTDILRMISSKGCSEIASLMPGISTPGFSVSFNCPSFTITSTDGSIVLYS